MPEPKPASAKTPEEWRKARLDSLDAWRTSAEVQAFHDGRDTPEKIHDELATIKKEVDAAAAVIHALYEEGR